MNEPILKLNWERFRAHVNLDITILPLGDMDGSYVRNGARHGEERAIGLSRGGPTPKIHMCADAHGNPIDFEVTGGDVHDSKVAGNIIEKVIAKSQILSLILTCINFVIWWKICLPD